MRTATQPAISRWRPYLLEHLDRVYPCSANGSNLLKKSYPAYQTKVETAYLGTRDFGLSPEPQGDELHIVSCCNISPVKRVELLAQAPIPLGGQAASNCTGRTSAAGTALDALKAYAKEHLSFMDCQLAGPIQNEALMRYYQQHPRGPLCQHQQLGRASCQLMEACSFWDPAIAPTSAVPPRLSKTAKTGFLLPMEFAHKVLAEQIVAFSRLPQEQRQALRANCRKVWEEQFFGERNFTRFAEAIRP